MYYMDQKTAIGRPFYFLNTSMKNLINQFIGKVGRIIIF